MKDGLDMTPASSLSLETADPWVESVAEAGARPSVLQLLHQAPTLPCALGITVADFVHQMAVAMAAVREGAGCR